MVHPVFGPGCVGILSRVLVAWPQISDDSREVFVVFPPLCPLFQSCRLLTPTPQKWGAPFFLPFTATSESRFPNIQIGGAGGGHDFWRSTLRFVEVPWRFQFVMKVGPVEVF